MGISVLLAILANQSFAGAEVPAEPDYFETSLSVNVSPEFVGEVLFAVHASTPQPVRAEIFPPTGTAVWSEQLGGFRNWRHRLSNHLAPTVLAGDWRLRLSSPVRTEVTMAVESFTVPRRCVGDDDCRAGARCVREGQWAWYCKRNPPGPSFCAQNPIGTACGERRICGAASAPYGCLDRAFITEAELPLDMGGGDQDGDAFRVPLQTEIFGTAAPNAEDIFAIEVQERQTLIVAIRDPATGTPFVAPASSGAFGPFTVAVHSSTGEPVRLREPAGRERPSIRVADLAPGIYNLTLSTSTAASYLLTLDTSAPACGDGIRETAAGELCDGADSPFSLPCTDCQPELPDPIVVSTVIDPPYATDRATVIPVILQQDADLSVRLVDAVQGCIPTDYPTLRLLGTDLETVLDDAAAGATFRNCPSVSTSRQHQPELGRVDVPAGTYYLVVGPFAARAAGNPWLEIDIRNRDGRGRYLPERTLPIADHNFRRLGARNYFLLNPQSRVPNPLELAARSLIVTRAKASDGTNQRYSVEVAEGDRISAAIAYTEGTFCYGPWDRQLLITSAEGPVTPILKNSGGCWSVVANDLDAGTYEIEVQRTDDEALLLSIQTAPPRCGDGTVDRKAGERCEPGPLPPYGKRKCSEVCRAFHVPIDNSRGCASEAACADTFAPWRNLPLAANMEAHLDHSLQDPYDIFEQPLEVYEDLLLNVLTFAPDDPGELCPPGLDLTMSLTTADGALHAYSDDIMAGNRCPGFDAIPLAAGEKYLLRIKNYSTNAVGAPFRFLLDTQRATICGNGVVEAAAGETCDDGNIRSWDGCDAQCQREAQPTTQTETEPNNTLEQATLLSYGIDQEFAATLGPPDAGPDFYAVWLPPGQSKTLTIETYDPQLVTCRRGGPVDTVVFVTNAFGYDLARDDDTVGHCSRLTQSLVGGETGALYYVRIQRYAFTGGRVEDYLVQFRWQ